MSFAQRAKAGREEGAGGFVFPKLEGWVRLKGWKFGLSKKKNPMFTLELKILDDVQVLSRVLSKGVALTAADLKGRVVKERVTISSAADWQFDRFLAYLEDSGMDLSQMDDKDPNYQDIQDALEYLEDQGQKIKISLEPQEEDPRYYRLKFLEVQKVGEGSGGPVVEDPPAAATPPAAPTVVATPVVSAPPAQPDLPPDSPRPVAAPVVVPKKVPDPDKKKKPWEK